jgi:hypothetical protein
MSNYTFLKQAEKTVKSQIYMTDEQKAKLDALLSAMKQLETDSKHDFFYRDMEVS